MVAAANTYRANIFVFYRRQNCPPQLFQPAEQSGENMFLEFDSTDNCQHYNPLVRRSDSTENDVTAPAEHDGSPPSTDAVIAPVQLSLRRKKNKNKKRLAARAHKKQEKAAAAAAAATVGPRRSKKRRLNRQINEDATTAEMQPQPVQHDELDAAAEFRAPTVKGPRCGKCNLHCSKGKLMGKNRSAFICKNCNTTISTLRRIYGNWPPLNFQELNVDLKQQFYQRCKDTSGQTCLKMLADDYQKISKTESVGTEKGGSYLPLSVYEKQGYDVERIHKHCKDKMEHPVLGTVYKLEITKDFESSLEAHERGQTVHVGEPRAPTIINNVGGGGGSTRSSAETREAVRISKAEVMQASRLRMQNQKAAEKMLKQLVKTSFNLKTAATASAMKILSGTDKIQVLALRKTLNEKEKLCTAVVHGKVKDHDA